MKIAVTVVLLSVATFVGVFAYAKSHNMGFLETAGMFRIRQWGNNGDDVDSSSSTLASSSSSSQLLPSSGSATTAAFTEEEIIAMRQRLSPRELIQVDQKLVPHQFLHLHHMKTGGTCTFIQCECVCFCHVFLGLLFSQPKNPFCIFFFFCSHGWFASVWRATLAGRFF
jgi:hypothetical protein